MLLQLLRLLWCCCGQVEVEVVVQVKARGPPADDDSSIAAQLMHVLDPRTGKPLADKYLLPQFSVLFWAGFDTTGNTMTWTLFLISQHPQVSPL